MRNTILAILLCLVSLTALQAQRLVEVGQGYSSTSVNTTIFRNSSLTSFQGRQYTAYYDDEGWMVIACRKLRSDEWTTTRTQYRGNVRDAHNGISLMVDGDGYLHVAFDHHGHPLNYCRSVAPYTLTLDEKEPMIGSDEGDVTYPEFYRLANGDLLFAYRSGASGRGNLVLNRYSLQTRRWERVQDILIDGEDRRNAYWQLYVDAAGTIHLSWVWRETWLVETNHDLCYARSKDGGKTWEKSTGERYTLPIRLENAEIACPIPQNSELINQTSTSADERGNPYIASYWRSSDSDIPQYRLVWHDGQSWQNRQISDRKTPFTLRGGGTKMIPIARPRMVVDRKRGYYVFRDAERGERVSIYYTRNIRKGRWRAKDLTDFAVHAWEPTLDAELWKTEKRLHLFVQDTHQGDGERVVKSEASPVYVLEFK